MPEVRRKGIAPEALIDLRQRLEISAPRSHERRTILQQAAQLYGVSEVTLYRALRLQGRLRALQRSDYGTPRKLPKLQQRLGGHLLSSHRSIKPFVDRDLSSPHDAADTHRGCSSRSRAGWRFAVR
jgi:hypothetical protein